MYARRPKQKNRRTAEADAGRGIDGDRKKLMTLVFSPVRRQDET
jgi:hypothetical protein